MYQPDISDVYYHKALNVFLKGKYKKARKYLTKILEHDLTSPWIYLIHDLSYIVNREKPQEPDWFYRNFVRTGITLESAGPLRFVDQGGAKFSRLPPQSNGLADAMDGTIRAMTDKINDQGKPNSYRLRGFSYYIKGEYDKAMADLKKSINLDPKQPMVELNIALILFRNGSHDLGMMNLVKSLRATDGGWSEELACIQKSIEILADESHIHNRDLTGRHR